MPASIRCPKCKRIYLCPERLEACLSNLKGRLPSLICGSCCGHGTLPDSPIREARSIPQDWMEGSYVIQQRRDKDIRLMNKLIRKEGLTIEEAFARVTK